MENKQRIIQELVPGKQITLAHIIANPDPILYQKLGLNPGICESCDRRPDGQPSGDSDHHGRYRD